METIIVDFIRLKSKIVVEAGRYRINWVQTRFCEASIGRGVGACSWWCGHRRTMKLDKSICSIVA